MPNYRVLDVGCGINKHPGAVGIDRNPSSAADIICDLDHGRLPFRDNSFDHVLAIHVIEHAADVIRTMEEFHRLLRPGAGTSRGARAVPRPVFLQPDGGRMLPANGSLSADSRTPRGTAA